MSGFFSFLFGIDTAEEEAGAGPEEIELPEAPEQMPVEIDNLQGLIDRMSENQVLGMEDGIRFESDEDDDNDEEQEVM